MKKLAYLTVLFHVLLLSNSFQLVSQDYKFNKETTEYFPNTVGNEWTYSRLNELEDNYDTVLVKIVADTIIEGMPFNIWEYISTYSSEKYYYSDTKDTIIILNAWYQVVQQFIIPFEIGQEYSFSEFSIYPTKYMATINKVLDKHEVMVGKRKFKSYLIIHKGKGLNDYLTERIWFKPEIGIVKIDKHCWSFCNMNETWKLIGCNIK